MKTTKNVRWCILALAICSAIFGCAKKETPTAKAPTDATEKIREEIIAQLRKRWGSRAQIYWNETGVVIISVDGYVSEFVTATGETRRFGIIPPNKQVSNAPQGVPPTL